MKGLIILTILFLVALPFDAHEEGFVRSITGEWIWPKAQRTVVVIDAGHGGKDSGALGTTAQEKDIALKIALKVGEYINTYLPEVKVVYTRDKDEFVPLYERAEIANKHKADVFISIHCNSLPPKKKHIDGTETYVMGLHTAEENLAVAKRENQVVLLESDYNKRYDGFDPNSPEAHIMLSMYQNAYLGQSILLAEKLEYQFKERAKRNSRGVKQAGFVVLKASAMPSVLIETGFLSNEVEEKYLESDNGQAYIASAIYRAFKEYLEAVGNAPAVREVVATTASQENSSIVFKVQLASSPTEIDLKTGRWVSVKGVEVHQIAGMHKYLVGSYSKFSEAVDIQTHWRKNGFEDAFVVAYQGKQRISITKAKEMLGQ